MPLDCCCERVGLFPWQRALGTPIGHIGEEANFRRRTREAPDLDMAGGGEELRPQSLEEVPAAVLSMSPRRRTG